MLDNKVIKFGRFFNLLYFEMQFSEKENCESKEFKDECFFNNLNIRSNNVRILLYLQ